MASTYSEEAQEIWQATHQVLDERERYNLVKKYAEPIIVGWDRSTITPLKVAQKMLPHRSEDALNGTIEMKCIKSLLKHMNEKRVNGRTLYEHRERLNNYFWMEE